MITWDDKTTEYKSPRIKAVIRTGVSLRLSNRICRYSMTGEGHKATAMRHAVYALAEKAAEFQAKVYCPENVPGFASFDYALPDGSALHLTAIYGMVVSQRKIGQIKGDFYLVVVLNDEVEWVLEHVFQFTDKWDGLIVEDPPKKLAKLAKRGKTVRA